jgi:hypothetical protein
MELIELLVLINDSRNQVRNEAALDISSLRSACEHVRRSLIFVFTKTGIIILITLPGIVYHVIRLNH